MINFYNNLTGEKLLSISIDGYFAGEITATKELLSYEKNIPIENIVWGVSE